MLLAALAIFIGALVISTTGSESLAAFARSLNTYSNLFVAVVTVVIAAATVVYVRLTYSLLLEAVEARRSEVRPFLRPALEKPRVGLDKGNTEPHLFFDVPLKVTNHGRGRAFGVRVTITVPYAINAKEEGTQYVQTTVAFANGPDIDAAGDLEGQARHYMPAYDLPTRGLEFLRLEARFEDTDQGLYYLTQFYDLLDYTAFQHGADERQFMLTLRYEALFHFPYTRRKFVRDSDMAEVLAWGEAPVYERGTSWSN